jgi:ATP-dependent Clp protease ATP-binding subunit ClpA
MVAQDLEVTLHKAFVEARQARHEFITVEHLLLALLDNPSAAKVLRACACNIEDLRKSLRNFVCDNTPVLAQSSEADTEPAPGFQRVIKRAIMHVQSTSAGKKAVTGANVLVAIFGEKDSHAVYYLHQQGVTRAEIQVYDLHQEGATRADTTVSARKLDIPRVLPDDEVYDLHQEGATRADVVNRRSRGITKALREAVKDIVKRRWRSITKAPQSRAVIAQELEVSLHMAFVEARQARHKFLTVEHLLLALLDNPLAAEVLRACACNIEDLRKTLQNFLSDNTPVLPQSS